jgi:hypothetical protein
MNTGYGKWFAIFVLMAFMGPSLSGFATAAITPKKILETKEETGTTDILGGGDYVYVRFNKDAAFGVIYGTENNPNSIIIVAMQVRYLGVANVKDVNGASIGKTVPIPVLTIFAMQLNDIFEFNDTNGDGICNYKHAYDGLNYGAYTIHEPIYKSVSLQTAWTRGEINSTVDQANKQKTWSFSLTAKDLPYRAIGNSSSIANDVVNKKFDKVEFTFHLTASVVHYDNISVPSFSVVVEKNAFGKYDIQSSTREADRTFSGDMGNYVVKFDQGMDGWDFDKTNKNPYLLMEWHAIIGTLIPTKVAAWINAQLTGKVDKGADAKMTTESGAMDINETTAKDPYAPLPDNPQKIKFNRIDCGGDWTRVGRLTWASNVTVDGKESTMYAQVQGGKKVTPATEKGKFHGYAILAGFSYPGGKKIFHDPGIGGSVPININFATGRNFRGVVLVLGLGAVIGLVAVVGVAYSMKKGKGQKGYYNGTYDVNGQEEKGSAGWGKYYKK